MKRFLLFAGDNYYPAGGMDDFLGSFDTIENAMTWLLKGEGQHTTRDWWHIYDTKHSLIVDRSA